MWNRVTLSLANAHDRKTDPPSDNNNEWLGSQVAADEHQPEQSSLVINVSRQSRGVSGLVADEHQLTANPLVTRDLQGAASEDLSQESCRCSTQAVYQLAMISPLRLTR